MKVLWGRNKKAAAGKLLYCTTGMCRAAQSWTEWAPLQSVILGSSRGKLTTLRRVVKISDQILSKGLLLWTTLKRHRIRWWSGVMQLQRTYIYPKLILHVQISFLPPPLLSLIFWSFPVNTRASVMAFGDGNDDGWPGHLDPDWNISTMTREVAMDFFFPTQRMNLSHCVELSTVHSAQPWRWGYLYMSQPGLILWATGQSKGLWHRKEEDLCSPLWGPEASSWSAPEFYKVLNRLALSNIHSSSHLPSEQELWPLS